MKITRYTELVVYQTAKSLAMEIFVLSKSFPPEERYSLTDQIRRSSRSVCANLAEAWRKRHYKSAFIAKIVDCESEASETQTWLEFAQECGYLDPTKHRYLYDGYDRVAGQLVTIRLNPDRWILPLR